MNSTLSGRHPFRSAQIRLRLIGGALAGALSFVPYVLVMVASGGASQTLIDCALATIPIAAIVGAWHAPEIVARRHGQDWTIVGRATASLVILIAIEGYVGNLLDLPWLAQSAFVQLVVLSPHAYVLALLMAIVWVRVMQRATPGVPLAPLVGHSVSEPVLGAYLRFESHALRHAVARRPAADTLTGAGSVAETLDHIIGAIESFTDSTKGEPARTPLPYPADTAGWLIRLDAALADLDAITLEVACSGRLTAVIVPSGPDRQHATTLGGQLLGILTGTTIGRWELEQRLRRSGVALPDHGRRLRWQVGTAR